MIDLVAQELAQTSPELLPLISLFAALVLFAVCGVALFVIDVREHRLPNALTGTLAIGATALLLTSTLTASSDSLLHGRAIPTLVGAMAYCMAMFILHVVTRAGIGMGDVKLAAGLGLYTGFLGIDALIAGFVLAFLIGGVQAVFLVLFRGASKSTRIAFGPAMLVGCLLILLM
ncbi:MAG TPA: prepilin peptidase [Enteractinococcus helveticum]|uniref:Prepilin peptidase n=1 Tax=Enteractinococcus helveticum TaxID=1837282 RepID=A0A921FLE7_9MICC|nr:prepilin peptidase [Enteractinococcus helveticum]HJF13452.1 prepilin peptidase [Enteractinococcus helveticum]